MAGVAGRCCHLWMSFLLVSCHVTVALAKLCAFSENRYNMYTLRMEKVLTSTECKWDCCEDDDSPCCVAPINMVVGVILGALVVFVMVTTLICYYCVYRRNQPCTNILRRFIHRRHAGSMDPATHNNSVYFSESSENIEIGAPPSYREDPPSYDEVIKGLHNAAFKPVSTETVSHSRS